MREIKCRGKRIDNGKWVEGYYCKHIKRQLCPMGDKLKEDDVEHIIFFDGFADWNMPQELRGTYILPETVGQYTGIKDDNGTEIYEGDIIEVFDDDGNMDCYSLGAGEVKFCRGEWCIYDGQNNSLYDICDVHLVEVIGNIHDNPELMEE